jgi:predicted transposase/invertase (TIGR01784 family)
MILDVEPTVDYAFKYLFGRDQNRPILVNVVDSVLTPPPEHRITDVDLLNPFNPKEALDDKLSILDIKARDQSGRQLNIEMQLLAFKYYEKRILYYWSKFHQQQLHEGQDYLTIRPTISISFLNHVLFPHVPDYHLRFYLTETDHSFRFTDDIEFHVIELPKFVKTPLELDSDLDIWLYFLRHAAKIDTDAVPSALQRPMVLRAVEELKMLAQSNPEKELYEARRKFQFDYQTGMKVAREEGREEGRETGREEGREKGREEGREEGRLQAQIEGRVAMIHFCEQVLGRPETSTGQLARLPFDELSRLAETLQSAVRQQR